jgi:hypothetical protein
VEPRQAGHLNPTDMATPLAQPRLSLAQIGTALGDAGLVILGAFHPGPEDHVPNLSDARRAATIILAGTAGGSMWPFFQPFAKSGKKPLNEWSAALLKRLAAQFSARALSPSEGPPYHPFQRWALRSGEVHLSPIQILIHPTYGLWHSYRGALIFADHVELPAPQDIPSPCNSCAAQPCRNACPVGAFRPDATDMQNIYDLEKCAGHVGGTDHNECRMTGCAARHACPIGQDHAYPPAQAQFHMAAIVKTHGPTSNK